jgi:nucleotide-binding universal stress UspA family protein
MALRYAEAIALRANSILTVTLANESLLVEAAAAARRSGQLAAQSAAELEGFIATTLRPDTRTQLRVNAKIADGDPAKAILHVARRIRSDLIVVGTHGRTGVGRLFMAGSARGKGPCPTMCCHTRSRLCSRARRSGGHVDRLMPTRRARQPVLTIAWPRTARSRLRSECRRAVRSRRPAVIRTCGRA